jgi:hypothetical protein
MFPRLSLLALALPFFASAANAGGGSWTSAMIHSSVPAKLPAGTFVAKVSIEDSGSDPLWEGGMVASVVEVLQGDPGRKRVLLRLPGEWDSCTRPFLNGREGYIVGIPIGEEAGTLVLRPVFAEAKDQFALPENYVLEKRR